MKNFVIAYINFFDNEILMKKVEAENETKAVIEYFTEQYGYDFSEWADVTLDEIQQLCFDYDSMVGVTEI